MSLSYSKKLKFPPQNLKFTKCSNFSYAKSIKKYQCKIVAKKLKNSLKRA